MNNHDTIQAKQEDINITRNKMFDEMIYRLDDRLIEFRSLVDYMQKVAKDYKGYDFTKDLNEHLLQEM